MARYVAQTFKKWGRATSHARSLCKRGEAERVTVVDDLRGRTTDITCGK
jgi:hypothetical protein